MSAKKIKSALISVFDKGGLDNIIKLLQEQEVKVYSTGGTYKHLEAHGLKVIRVEDITSYPSILDGRVKTLHPKVFGGILARREESHLSQLGQYDIPEIDLVVVDLYPFEKTVASTDDAEQIIEKIDIGGIALIRAAAKNYGDVVIIPSQKQYPALEKILSEQAGSTTLADRKHLAAEAFAVSSHYDTAIFSYFNRDSQVAVSGFRHSEKIGSGLRYGENPHQSAVFFGDMEEVFDKLSGKELSFNNLVDVDSAIQLMAEFESDDPTFAVLKHTNACGVATRDNVYEAWTAALAGDPVSAFGGILISNTTIDLNTAKEINKLFYEVLIAPDFDKEALTLLTEKKKRILLKIKQFYRQNKSFKTILNGVIQQDMDLNAEASEDLKVVTEEAPSVGQIDDLLFANKLVKHLKSNTIVLARNRQLLGMGCGQTSRVDACEQAIAKAKRFGFDISGAAMASDAFFPFPDCVEIGHKAGVQAVIQPGGSIKDQLSIDYCNKHNLPMVFTGIRHFKH